MTRLRCSIPNCSFITPLASQDPLCNMAILLAHINMHLVSLLLHPAPPQPSVSSENLFPPPFPFSSFLRYPIPPASDLPVVIPNPTTGATTSSRHPPWFLSPLINQRTAERRRLLSPQMELESAANFRSGAIPSTLTTSTMVTEVGTAPRLFISNVESLKGRAGNPFAFDTPK